METKKRANASQVEQGDGGDHRHVENSPLSEIGGSKGARGPSGIVGSERLRIYWILPVDYSLFIMYTIYLLIGELLA